ncbi:MAG: hypothetical protein JO022_10865, partial [Acidobacteriaceae bacterium]|nr:hypothetical protein [Acidobacteriaceae bacterium]
VSAVEDGITNVCGLGPEDVLQRFDFEIDALITTSAPLTERLRPLQRRWKWMTVGPLVYRHRLRSEVSPRVYPAGDALSFVDPFTGSGMLSALASGRLAGVAAARGSSVEQYMAQCRSVFERPFQFASLFRGLLANGWGETLAGYVPGSWLVRLTRARKLV